ncbi:RNA polymerase sigma-70 factor, ECF subfamily [Dyadobacter koreensis]|uniref:RNA polymerase sigma-70 factor, ECF subfamily n=1 Tax=Dyadobacter koreensis TaxID=408657 RepID=A0A1H6Q168_9BACT|nr:sigma-70 family RNA polymerase sigma factor [Dyadobacter koreensis]SEI37599.1 RNA polymerase sigma-70 factor, ECF subfamily [Dyadobacter koreensis]
MSILQSSDEVLVERLRKGDQLAFKEIYSRFWKKLFSIALKKVNDRAVVEGIVQDIFLKLWERKELLNVDNLEAYLVTAVRYGCINHIRLSMLHEKFEMHVHQYYRHEISCTEEQVEFTDLMASVEKVLCSFPESSQQIFRMHRIECHSAKEISCKLGIPQRTVELRLSKVVQTLRIYLDDYL